MFHTHVVKIQKICSVECVLMYSCCKLFPFYKTSKLMSEPHVLYSTYT
jgi:hypothetical protein